MRPRWPIRVLVRTGDLIAIVIAAWIARIVWLASTETPLPVAYPLWKLFFVNPHVPPFGVIVVAWYVALSVGGLQEPLRMISSLRISQGILRAWVGVGTFAILLQYFMLDKHYSRTLLMGFIASSGVAILAWRLLFLRVQAWIPDVVPRIGVIVVGVGEDAALLADRLGRYGRHLYEIRGYVAGPHAETAAVSGPVVGTLADLGAVAARKDVHLVMLATRGLGRDEALSLVSTCQNLGLEVLQVPFTWGLAAARVEVASVGELDLVRIGGLAYPSAAETAKRVFDIVAVLIGGGLILPFLLVVALMIKLQDGGPVFYVGSRAGRGGRHFPFYKFRSMVVNANAMKDELRAKNETDGRLFKLSADPRITKFGAFIRKYSIDEFPQLINVLRGDMNLVGPRPLPVEDLVGIDADAEHRYWFDQRSRVNPGITGLWQVEGRSDLAFERMVELDVHYIQHWSLLLDLQILLRTVPAVLRGRGAK